MLCTARGKSCHGPITLKVILQMGFSSSVQCKVMVLKHRAASPPRCRDEHFWGTSISDQNGIDPRACVLLHNPHAVLYVCQSPVQNKCSVNVIPFLLTNVTEFPEVVRLLGRTQCCLLLGSSFPIRTLLFPRTSPTVLDACPLSLPHGLGQVMSSLVSWV